MTLQERKQREFAQQMNNEIIARHRSICIRKIVDKDDLLAANIVSSTKPNRIRIKINLKTN